MAVSLSNAVSGLKAHQTKMDVIANNVANVNTNGFKASTVTFKDSYSQMRQQANAADMDTGKGGTNPMQVGSGVSIGSIDRSTVPGAMKNTGDVAGIISNADGLALTLECQQKA